MPFTFHEIIFIKIMISLFVMEFFVDVPEVAVGDVGIDLGRADVCMAKQGLHRAQISAITQEISRETVTDDVRGDLFGNTGLDRIMLHNPFDRALSKWADFATVGLVLDIELDKKSVVEVLSLVEILLDHLFGRVREENHSHLATFTPYRELISSQVDVSSKGTELGYTQSGREE